MWRCRVKTLSAQCLSAGRACAKPGTARRSQNLPGRPCQALGLELPRCSLHVRPWLTLRALSDVAARANEKPAAKKDPKLQSAASASPVKQEKKGKLADPSPWPLLWSLWPREISHNARIVFALSGLIVGKALAIYAPLQLGHLVNELGAGVEVLPIGILAAYGLARLLSSGFNELRSALFAIVSQATCRALARRSFQHLHSLDTSYLVSNKPGALSTVVSRATKSLTQVLNMLLFNVFPIFVEFSMALAVMTTMAGLQCTLITIGTIGLYTLFTKSFSEHRRMIMRQSRHWLRLL